ncbi:MAG TPA: hypothetical protein VGA70_11685 [Longimicrobiales bacterium]|jgi:hypothetical protein
MIHFAATRTKLRVFQEYLDGPGASIAPGISTWDYESVTAMDTLPGGTWILADLDALAPNGMVLAKGMHRALTEAGCRILNDPGRTLQRLELLQALHREGINSFRAVRAMDDLSVLRFPVFLRGASDHLGPLGDLLRSSEEVARSVAHARALAIDPGDLIVVEYEDTSDAAGLFHKFGVLVLGDRAVPQHLFRAPTWMIKSKRCQLTLEGALEESAWVQEFEHEAQVRRVLDIAGAEYGRVDYSVGRDGRIQVWEVNLCPILGRGEQSGPQPAPEILEIRSERAQRSYAMYEDAWRALLAASPWAPSVPLEIPMEVRERTRVELAPRTGAAGLVEALRAKAHFSRW